MKYGLMYYKDTDNIGDDIQTYVAMKYLPHIDYYIDREDLSCFVPKQKEYVSMIMNGWFIHNKLAWPPSPYINPLLISMHFKSLEETDVGDIYLKKYGREFLKKYEPVGARDLETLKRLKNNNIQSYFSGCLTLTLRKFHGIRKKDKICLVDVSNEVEEKVRKSTTSEIQTITHALNQNTTSKKDFKDRMKDVEQLLKKYQESKLVITTRLHAALPCVALGTPVIVLHKKIFDEDRLGTFFEMFENYIDEDFLKMDIINILTSPQPNKKEYLKLKESLDKTCKSFIKNCEKTNKGNKSKKTFDIDILPNIEDYRQYAKRLEWYKSIYEKERLNIEKLERKRIDEFNLYHKNLDELNNKYEVLKKKMDKSI